MGTQPAAALTYLRRSNLSSSSRHPDTQARVPARPLPTDDTHGDA